MAGQQSWGAEETSSQPNSRFSLNFGNSGFDFGWSGQKTGQGYGLLGDARSIRASLVCDDCPPDAPCPACEASAQSHSGGDGAQIIPAQYPIPIPGLIPPVVGAVPQQPSRPPIVGDPSAWWNKGDADVGDWLRGWAPARPSEDVEKMCWEEYMLDPINCNLKKAYAGADAAHVCHEQAAKAYSDCRKSGKKSDISRFDKN